jgi:hypothetical protein
MRYGKVPVLYLELRRLMLLALVSRIYQLYLIRTNIIIKKYVTGTVSSI